jgi:hypothetical protein
MEHNETFDWSRFTVRQLIKSNKEEIEKAFTTPGGLESWFLRLAEFTGPSGKVRKRSETVQPSDGYKWMWHGYPDSVIETGTVLVPEKHDIIRFIFGKAGTVAIKIHYDIDYQILELNQSSIPVHEEAKVNWHVGCKTGWTFYLLNLKSVLEGGHDLRNKIKELNLD